MRRRNLRRKTIKLSVTDIRALGIAFVELKNAEESNRVPFYNLYLSRKQAICQLRKLADRINRTPED